MIDLPVKFAAVAAAARLLTLRVTPRNAANAHRLWLAVMFSPVLFLLGGAALPPIAYLQPHRDVWPAAITAPTLTVLAIASGVYAVVAVALLLRTLGGVVAVQRLIGRSTGLGGDEVERLRQLAGQPGIDIREADLLVPVTAGFVKPVIILPAGWRSMTPAALTAILLHEAAHVRRRDCAIAPLRSPTAIRRTSFYISSGTGTEPSECDRRWDGRRSRREFTCT